MCILLKPSFVKFNSGIKINFIKKIIKIKSKKKRVGKNFKEKELKSQNTKKKRIGKELKERGLKSLKTLIRVDDEN